MLSDLGVGYITLASGKMHRYQIYACGELIGWSNLEAGDPPMGVASGRFHPLPAYEPIRHCFLVSTVAGTGSGAKGIQLSATTAEGKTIESSGGVHIEDYSGELGPEDLEVSILGIFNPDYASLFPEHVAAYERQFRDAG